MSSVKEMTYSDAVDTKKEKESREQVVGYLDHEYSFLLAREITKDLYDRHLITLQNMTRSQR